MSVKTLVILFVGTMISSVTAHTSENDSESSYANLVDAVYKVADSFQGLAEAKRILNDAVKGTSNCGLSDSNTSDGVNDVISANIGAAQSLSDLNTAMVRATDENGELTGDLSPVTKAFGAVSNAIDTLRDAVKSLANKIDYESGEDLEGIALTLQRITGSLTNLTESFEDVTGPQDLFADLSDALHNFKDALQALYDAVKQLIGSLSSKLSSCGYSDDVPNALTSLNQITKRFMNDLSQ